AAYHTTPICPVLPPRAPPSGVSHNPPHPAEKTPGGFKTPPPPLMCQASSMHPHLTRFGGFILSVNIFIKIMPTHSIKQKVSQIKKERNVQICCFPYLLTLT
ncbi:hypothetical protein U4Y22_23540, partial [Escherichia coli]|nr:hypothetical protein [Escherichia coli]